MPMRKKIHPYRNKKTGPNISQKITLRNIILGFSSVFEIQAVFSEKISSVHNRGIYLS